MLYVVDCVMLLQYIPIRHGMSYRFLPHEYFFLQKETLSTYKNNYVNIHTWIFIHHSTYNRTFNSSILCFIFFRTSLYLKYQIYIILQFLLAHFIYVLTSLLKGESDVLLRSDNVVICHGILL